MEKRKDILAVAVLLLVIVVRFAPFLFLGMPINSDSWKSYYPWQPEDRSGIKTIVYDSNMEYGIWFPMVKKELSEGRFPHWNPYSGCGKPLYANHLVPIFHIPFALALLWPGDLVFAAYAFFMAITGTLFFYWFLRNWKLSVFVSLFGGLVFFLSGWQYYLYPPEVATFIWIPAILLFYDRFLESNRLSDACWGAFCIGQLLIAGYPIMIAHFFYFVVVYVIWRYFHKSFNWKVSMSRWITAILIMAVMGVLVSAVQNYPTYKLSRLIDRDISSEKQMLKSAGEMVEQKQEELEKTGSSSGFGDLILSQIRKKSMILIPTFVRDMNASRNFTGPVVVLLALIALFAASRQFNVIKVCFVVSGVLFIISPVYSLFAKIVPGWSISALPPREAFYFILFFMSALGLDSVTRMERISKFLRGLALAVFLISIILLSQNPAILSVLSGHEPDIFRWTVHADALFVMLSFICLFQALSTILGVYGNSKTTRFGYSVFVFLVFGGLLAHFYIFQYFASPEIMPEIEVMTQIKNTCSDGRIVRFDPEKQRLSFSERLDHILPPNIPTRFQLMDAQLYDSMILAGITDFMDRAAPGSILRNRGILHISNEEYLKPDSFYVQAAGIRYVMVDNSNQDQFSHGVKLGDFDGVQLFDLSEDSESTYVKAFNRYELEDEYQMDPDMDDFSRKVILDHVPLFEDGSELYSKQVDIPVNLEITEFKRKTGTLDISFEVSEDCVLYVADTYHPRWRAVLDNVEVEIIKANYNFRAITVEKGVHKLKMWYDGIELKTGGYITFAGLMILLLICFIDSQTDRLRESS